MITDSDVRDAELRSAMVRELRAHGALRSDPAAAAFATVPRHLFTQASR